jgi:hypothetical protein
MLEEYEAREKSIWIIKTSLVELIYENEFFRG